MIFREPAGEAPLAGTAPCAAGQHPAVPAVFRKLGRLESQARTPLVRSARAGGLRRRRGRHQFRQETLNVNEEDIRQVMAAASTLAEDLMRAELELACSRLMARGVPQDQVAQVLVVAAEMLRGGTALVEREVAGALGTPPSVH